MIDTKEKLKHCLAVEKNIYFPGGGNKASVWNTQERCTLRIYL